MTTTPTRTRLRALRGATHEPAPLPFTYRWLRNQDAGLWTLVVVVKATRQKLRVSYAVAACPGDAAGVRIGRRLFRLAGGAS